MPISDTNNSSAFFFALCLVVLLLAILLPSSLQASPAPGDASSATQDEYPWPSGKITVWDGSGRPVSTVHALAKWNEVGLPVRFVLTDDRKAADVVILANTEVLAERCPLEDPHGCAGVATRGYTKGEQSLISVKSYDPQRSRDVNLVDTQTILDIDTMVHEVGHVLGLDHNQAGCSLMSDEGWKQCNENPAHWACGPTLADAKAAADLYKVSRNPQYNPWCSL